MAAYLRHMTMAHMSGDGPNHHSPPRLHDGRGIRDSPTSPLKIFVQAKRSANEIFEQMDVYVVECLDFIKGGMSVGSIITNEIRDGVESYRAKVAGIREVLKRDHMKVAFFGRTSNGKSTVINAMLRDKVLPSGIGHTTNCFLQVCASETDDAYLTLEGMNERRNVASVAQLGHALCEEKLNESAMAYVHWPVDRCPLLRDDVVFVDSPGVDVSPNLDDWIDQHCVDADVFVLVANAESTLMRTEKNFFHKVSSKLSKPNIFVLNNRWDASAAEPDFLEQVLTNLSVRAQHMERTMDFLVNELQVCTKAMAEERVFFVSARETLNARLLEKEGRSPNAAALGEGFSVRYFEFQNFERKFQECISKSAVKTKFELHVQRGKNITADMIGCMESVQERAEKCRITQIAERRKLVDRKETNLRKVQELTHKMKDKIVHMVNDVERKVAAALNDEIRLLSGLVDDFNYPFNDELVALNGYKREIHAHVESGLGNNLKTRLSYALALNVESARREMTDRLSELLPQEKRHVANQLIGARREPFEMLYRLNCDNLCGDFREDIRFKFSLSPKSLYERFFGNADTSRISMRSDREPVPRPMVMRSSDMHGSSHETHSSPSSILSFLPPDQMTFLARFGMASLTTQWATGGMVGSICLLRAVGWRALLITGGIYAGLYVYERMTWTRKAKEQAFKQQYVQHASRKLRLIVDLISTNCSHQVQQELSGCFARLCQLVDTSTDEMAQQIKHLEAEITCLEQMCNSAKILRNKANFLNVELNTFYKKFLEDDEE
ncbi:unnamed protein product [Notodromas monacha]|uniref:Dynamin-type G domain-containing protein n=1 Tax=Notodromas monacha TaxID=399045 RepID=A0A7R9BKQ9_9CRUS|nr:unnamed protein product [Notodromas monacha]CAG0915769.1 unnamed protein product [Notodromas monacha]